MAQSESRGSDVDATILFTNTTATAEVYLDENGDVIEDEELVDNLLFLKSTNSGIASIYSSYIIELVTMCLLVLLLS